MSTLGERIEQAMKLKGLKRKDLAEMLSISTMAVGDLINNKTKKPRYLVEIAEALGVDVKWLQTGEGAAQPKQIESNVGEKGGFDLWNSQTPLSDDDYEVPFYKDITLAAGTGSFEQADYNGFKLRFSKATLRRQGVEYHNAVCVTATGNSMEPVIPDGTTIGVDLGNKSIRDGKIYAINHGGLLRVKILSRLPNDLVVIRSYNAEEYPDETVHLSEVQVIGKVFWWSVLV